MTRRLFSLLRRTEGAATIELALVAPIFATMIVGVIDLTTAYNRELELEQAVQRAVERVMQTTAETTVESNIIDEASEAAGIDDSQVTVTYLLKCDDGALTEYDPDDTTPDDCDAGETETRYLNVVATDTFTPIIPLSNLGFASDHFQLRTETGIRTQ